MIDGIYSGSGVSAKNGVSVHVNADVTVREGRISSISLESDDSIMKFMNLVRAKIVPQIIEKQTVRIDAVSSATITSNAALNAVEGCILKAGGVIIDAALDDKKNVLPDKSSYTEYDCDILVIGAGAAGVAAALYASEAGKRTIILEKTGACGGQVVEANCILSCEHPLQRAAGVAVTKQDIFNELMTWNHWQGNSRVAAVYVNRAAATIDWLISHGVPIVYRGSEQESHKFDTALHFNCNNDEKFGFMNSMLEMAGEKGCRIIFDAAGEELIMDKEGRVIGAWAKSSDLGYLRIKASSVIVATGGYNANPEMCNEFFDVNCSYVEDGTVYTGEGVKMCWGAGADKFGTGVRILHCVHADRNLTPLIEGGIPAASQFTRMPALLMVNCRGERFMDEYKVLDSATCASAAVAQGDEGYFWTIIDQGTLDRLKDEGAGYMGITSVPGGPGENYLAPGFFENVTSDIEKAVEVGLIFKADTPEELAKKTGMNPETFTRELERYNGFCEKGADDDFFKAPKLLHKINKGPFYAEKSMATSLGSIGGVRVDEWCRCLDHERRIIPGLYCCGADAGALWPNGYGIMEGATSSWAFTSGLLAAEDAVNSVG